MKKNAVVGQSGGPTACYQCKPLRDCIRSIKPRSNEIGTVYGMIMELKILMISHDMRTEIKDWN